MTLSIDNGPQSVSGALGAHSERATPHEFSDSLQYRLLLAVCFAAFLVVGLIGRLAAWRWRAFGGSGFESRSVWHEALTRAHATAPYAFMC